MNNMSCQNIKVFIVNLDRSKERWEGISSQLDGLGVAYERFSAVDGSKLDDYTEHFGLKRFKVLSGHDLVPGEAGCSRSHVGIWEKVVAEGLDYAVVLEDDIIIKPAFVPFLEGAGYEGFDYLKIDTDESTYPYEAQKLNLINRLGYKLTECDPVPFCTGGYVISRRGATIFLRASRKMLVPIDILPQYTFPYTAQGYVTPQLVFQKEEDSTISGREFSPPPQILVLLDFLIKLSSRFVLRKLSVLLVKMRYRLRNSS